MKKTVISILVLCIIIYSWPGLAMKHSLEERKQEDEIIGTISHQDQELYVRLIEGDLAQKRIDSFNAGMKERKLPGSITSCRRVIDIPAGTAQGNNSYGGICILENDQKKETIMICNATLTNQFKINKVKLHSDVLHLSQFVNQNCVGG